MKILEVIIESMQNNSNTMLNVDLQNISMEFPNKWAALKNKINIEHPDIDNIDEALNLLYKQLKKDVYMWPDGKIAGKRVNGIYMHRSVANKYLSNDISQFINRLPSWFKFDIVVKNIDGSYSFVSVPDWNSAPEPQRMPYPEFQNNITSIKVPSNNDQLKSSKDTQIYHHKWQFVLDNYTGFNRNESILRSLLWTTAALPTFRSKIGRKDYWDSTVSQHLDTPNPRNNSDEQLPLWDIGTLSKTQKVTSDLTSINKDKAPASVALIDKLGGWKPGTINADIGGGKHDYMTELLRDKYNITNIIFDPFNRTQEHNLQAKQMISDHQADTVTVNNVLNVIREKNAREMVISQAANALKSNGTAYFLIYEGEGFRQKTGIGSLTTSGWQENKSTIMFLKEIQKYFNNVIRKGNLIIATGIKT